MPKSTRAPAEPKPRRVVFEAPEELVVQATRLARQSDRSLSAVLRRYLQAFVASDGATPGGAR